MLQDVALKCCGRLARSLVISRCCFAQLKGPAADAIKEEALGPILFLKSSLR